MSSLGNFFSEIVNGPDFNKITASSRGLIESMPALLDNRLNEIESSFGGAIETSRANVTSSIASDLPARGISSPEVAKASVSNIQPGLSGAYAAAHSALQQAKTNAKLKMSNAMSTYYQELADKQYKAMMGAFAARMGLVGALGGAAGSMIGGSPSPAKPLDNTDYGLLNREGI